MSENGWGLGGDRLGNTHSLAHTHTHYSGSLINPFYECSVFSVARSLCGSEVHRSTGEEIWQQV